MYYKAVARSLEECVCLEWVVILSVYFDRENRVLQAALTLLIVLLFATKARKMKNPERKLYWDKHSVKVNNYIHFLPYWGQTLMGKQIQVKRNN